MKIFYSWQCDLDKEYNETFIQNCLDKVIAKLNSSLNPREPFELDRDTRDVSGSPDIAKTILDKIEKSGAFVGDLSFIAEATNGKHCSNPNVLIELGYALKCLTDRCIVNVMNTAYGNPEGNMPFDFAHKRWPISYKLSKSNKTRNHEEQGKLIQGLEKAIKDIHAISGGSKAVPLPLKEDPSIDNIESHILHSNPKSDWKHIHDAYKNSAIYQKDANLRIEINKNDEGVVSSDFREAWAHLFPSPTTTSYWCDIWLGAAKIERRHLVSADGGRAMLPRPANVNGNLVEPLDYKLAEIFDPNDVLAHYFNQVGYQLL
ncbi:hypothetical protein [Nitrospira sp. Ecomares 2.1]